MENIRTECIGQRFFVDYHTNQKISIIIPVFNEEGNILKLYNELLSTIDQLRQFAWEIVFIDDGSSDDSWNILYKLAKKDIRIKLVRFSKNFGYQIALTAGYDHATGSAIITMDSDLQHPPSLIPSMINQWQSGFPIVYARRTARNDAFMKKLTARIYHAILDAISEVKIPAGISDFRLIDKAVLHQIKLCREKARYLRGMVAWTGFKSSFVDFDQPERVHGTTKYSWLTLFKIAGDGLLGFSLFPLKIAAYVGIFVILTGMLMLTIITVDSLFYQGHYPLFKWLVTVIYIFIGILFILLWILGEYIGRLFDQIKGRPLYIISQKENSD